MRTGLFALAFAISGCTAGTQENNATIVNDVTAEAGEVGNAAMVDPMNAANGTAPSGPSAAMATLRDPAGAERGTVEVREEGGGLAYQVMAAGMPAGKHGAHVHAVGKCDGPAFESAGGHWNPTSRQHGRENPQGAHSGDLPNIEIGANGGGTLAFTTAGATLAELMDGDGAAFLIHAQADDYRTDPSGNSGNRIACGVIQRR